MTLLRFLPLCCALACTPEKSESDSSVEDAEDTGFIERPEPTRDCTPETKVQGTPIAELGSPAVGDAWYMQLWCGEALQIGAYVLSATPPELVNIDSEEPIVTFVSPGDVTFDYRVGSDRATDTVTIVE